MNRKLVASLVIALAGCLSAQAAEYKVQTRYSITSSDCWDSNCYGLRIVPAFGFCQG